LTTLKPPEQEDPQLNQQASEKKRATSSNSQILKTSRASTALSGIPNPHLPPPQGNTSGTGTVNHISLSLHKLAYQYPKMITNLPVFYRSLVNKIRDPVTNSLVFDYLELDQIVESALAEKIPIISAKRWAITDAKKGQV